MSKLLKSPPKIFLRFFRLYCHPQMQDYIEGDLMEVYYERLEKVGKRKADIKFIIDVILLFRPGIIKPFEGINTVNHYDMIRNYFKIAIRSFLRKKVYSTINILGLSIGIACCLIIFEYVTFEYSFDTFHEKTANLYRVNQTTVRSGGAPRTRGKTGWGVGPALAEEVPEVVQSVRLHPEEGNIIVSNPLDPNKTFKEVNIFYTDSNFFELFTFPLILGNPKKALAEPETIILSESAAKKYFGDENPLGKTLNYRGWISGEFQVNGIFKDIPDHSHLQFDMLLSIADLLTKSDQYASSDNSWGWTNFITYVQLQEGVDLVSVEKKFTDIFREAREKDFSSRNTIGYMTPQPLLDIHLNESIQASPTKMGSSRAVYFFSIIGLVILLIAFINYVNLTTARALDRAHEVGVRKVVGAKRGQLITQFLTESALTIFLALTIAFLLVIAIKPTIHHITGINLTNVLWIDINFWLIVIIAFCSATLLAGLYPALMLSSFKPVKVLKGKNSLTAKSFLRQFLVVLQFATSIMLLVGTTIVYKQLSYMRNMELGMGLEQILTIPAPRILSENTSSTKAVEIFTQELNQFPAIRQTATSRILPGQGFNFYTRNIRKAGADRSTEINGAVAVIDTSFISVYDMELITGGGFKNISLPFPEDEPEPIILNETALQALDLGTVDEALYQEITIGGDKNRFTIVGVLKDFNWSSAHRKRENAFFLLRVNNREISIKLDTKNLSQTIASLEEVYKRLFPSNPFNYSFADETFAAQYQNDERFAKLFGLFAALAIFIACLGLFGLAAFTAQKRTKEIGIRKVVGATVSHIILLLSKDFLKLIMIGFLIAIPIAWYSMGRWLEDFAYQIEIGPEVFLLAGFTVVFIAILAVSGQSIKAALVNPVKSLKSE
ncbi:MAG: ABC transporter permease [Bacteroidota bacterium]